METLTFAHAIDAFISDMRREGRMTSNASERAYRDALCRHCDDVDDRDPRQTDRLDVKRTLARWTHPNTQRKRRSILVSFYGWTMEEGMRKDNPALQTRRPKSTKPQMYRLTRGEVARFLGAASGDRERRVAFLGICAGLRNAELRGLQGRHFRRPGFVHVSADIAKGGNERFVPVLPELELVVAEINDHVGDRDYVLPAQRWRNGSRKPSALTCWPGRAVRRSCVSR